MLSLVIKIIYKDRKTRFIFIAICLVLALIRAIIGALLHFLALFALYGAFLCILALFNAIWLFYTRFGIFRHAFAPLGALYHFWTLI